MYPQSSKWTGGTTKNHPTTKTNPTNPPSTRHVADILPPGLRHPAATSLLIVLHHQGPLVLLLGLPGGPAKEVPDALLPGGGGTRTHWVTASVFVLC